MSPYRRSDDRKEQVGVSLQPNLDLSSPLDRPLASEEARPFREHRGADADRAGEPDDHTGDHALDLVHVLSFR